jgi:mono/diheme cytochrome c family protein
VQCAARQRKLLARPFYSSSETIMNKVCALLFLLLLAMPVQASGYVYDAASGYWTLNGRSYQRTYATYFDPVTCKWVQIWGYHEVARKQALPDYTDPQWRTKILGIVAQRVEQQNYAESLRLLGFANVMAGYGPVFPAESQYSQGQAFAAQGNTLWGYSFSQLAQLYGDANPAVLYQMANSQTQGAQALAGQAQSGFNQLLAVDGENRAKLASIMLRGEAAERVLRALVEPGGKVETKGFSFQVTPGGPNQLPKIQRSDAGVAPEQKQALAAAWQSVAQAKCAGCHAGADAKGGFQISAYPGLTMEQKQLVWERIASRDAAKQMPRLADGKPGTPLTGDELKLFLLN